MKKLFAVLLALVVAMIPAAAFAQETAGAWVRISNPVIKAMGQEYLNLDGLRLEMNLADSESEDVLGTLELLADDESVVKGYIEYADGILNLTADGLSKQYTLPLEKMMEQSGKEMPADTAQVMLLIEAFENGGMEQFMEEVSVPFVEFSKVVEEKIVEGGYETIEMPLGETEMHRFDISLSEREVRTFVQGMFDAFFGSKLASQMLAINGVDKEELFEEMDLSKMLSMYGGIDMTIWVADDGSARIVEKLTMDEDNLDILMEYTADIYQDERGSWCDMRMEAAPQSGDEIGQYIKLEGSVFATEDSDGNPVVEIEYDATADLGDGEEELFTSWGYYYPMEYSGLEYDELYFTASASETLTEDGAQELSLQYYYAPADGVEYNYDEVGLSFYAGNAEEYSSLDTILQFADLDDGTCYRALQLNYGSDEDTFTLAGTFDGVETDTENGVETAGTLKLGVTQSDSMSFEIETELAYGLGMLDGQALTAQEKDSVNLMTMGEKDYDLISEEGEALASIAMMKIMAAVPSLASMMGIGM